jgi:Kef-type K+ transport system membrane component KefB
MVTLFKFGIALFLAILLGELSSRLKLPKLIGYIVGGFIFGPSLLNFFNKDFLEATKGFKFFALTFIMFLIGTKLKATKISRLGKGILKPAFLEILLTLTLVTLGALFFFKNILFALIVGIIASATAPAATAMVIEEYHSEGPLTDAIFFMVGIDNLTVLILFNLLHTFAIGKGSLTHIESLFFTLLISILVGIIFGLLFSYIESKLGEPEYLFLGSIGLLFVAFGISERLNLYPLLVALFIGFAYINSSVRNFKGLKSLDILHPPIYALFFIIAGASLHIELLRSLRFAVIVYVILRCIGKYFGANIGTKWAQMGPNMERFLGFGIFTHAGLATGLAIFMGEVGGEMGIMVMNLVLASTVFFEIFGPLILKESLVKVGEVRVVHLLKRGVEPILDLEFQTILHELLTSLGLRRTLYRKHPEEILVEHVMRRNFPSVHPDSHLDEVVKTFERTYCNSITVIDENHEYCGIIVLRELEELFLDEVTAHLIVAEDALKRIKPLNPKENLKEAFSRMREKRIDCLPVVDENNKVIGVILRRDILFALR